MKVALKDARKMFVALGYSRAEGWDAKMMTTKVAKLGSLVEKDQEVSDKDAKNLLAAVLKAQKDGKDIEITETKADKVPAATTPAPAAKPGKKVVAPVEPEEDDEDDTEDDDADDEDDAEPVAKVVPAKAAGKKAVKQAEPEEDDEDAETAVATKPAKKEKAEKVPKEKKGPGVIASIVEFLKDASEKAPLTKKDVHEKLKERFPDRAPESMWSTINIQIPNRLKVDRNVVVHKNENGYWVNSNEK